MNKIHNYSDFIIRLMETGFTMGGENSEGIFTLCDFFSDEIQWHKEDKETDPWEWRMRVLNEREDIAYSKVFFKKSGYITREWYSYFYAVRRGSKEFYDEYEKGYISHYAKRIYELIKNHRELPLHLIKQYGGFHKEEKSKFDQALTELQMNFYITMCGSARKKSKDGESYGWSSTVFCLVEDFFDSDIIQYGKNLKKDDAYKKIEAHIFQLNPDANRKKIKKFITG